MRKMEIQMSALWRECQLLDLVQVPGGGFSMGSTLTEVDRCVGFWKQRLVDPSYEADEFRRWILKEYPCRSMRMEPFRIMRFPVTNAQYRPFVEARSAAVPESLLIGEPDDHPVWGVSFDDATAFARWATDETDLSCALPTEEQWEYAARGSSRREFPFGDEFDPCLCNTIESGIGHTTPVDRYLSGASVFGIYDMAGNVEEWTCSRYAPYPGGTFIDDDLSRTLGPEYRILRGGSFARGGDLARCARRHGPLDRPAFRFVGFRLVVPG
jgi:toxoflavin biosynthesis protein ToxD